MHDLSYIPLSEFTSDGQTLVKWLGTFWTQVFTQPDLIKSYGQASALNLAQLYLDFIEALDLTDRRRAPVYHRKRWQPIVIKKSEQNTGNANLIRTDMDPPIVIGPQPADSTYAPGKIFQIGGNAEYLEVVSYPLPEGTVDVMTSIADNIVLPNAVLVRGVDFFVRDNTIFFLRDGDPFDSGLFPVRVYDGDEEVLLWASNSLVDRNYVYEHIGYALSIRRTESSAFYKRMLNGLWDLYNMGTPLAWFTAGLGAMLGEPTILSAGETIEVIQAEDERTLVITDKNVYEINPDATLRDKVVVGAEMELGELLTTTLRIYDTLDPMKMAAVSEFGEQMRTDIPSLFFGPAFFRSQLRHGLGATWDVVDIVKDGDDANGNAQLRFQLYGTDEDVERFWNDFWAEAADAGISSETCFQAYLNDIVTSADGSVYGTIAPLEYFMRYFLRGNAMVILVERDKLSDPDPDTDALEALNHLDNVLPAHIALFVIEQRTLGPDTYDLSSITSSLVAAVATTTTSTIREGGRSATGMTYTTRPPIIRWIPTCKE